MRRRHDAGARARQRRALLALTFALAVACGAPPPAGWAGDAPKSAPPPVDPDFIEFLGTIGSEDEDLIDYLAHNDPAKVAAATPKPKPPADPGGSKKE